MTDDVKENKDGRWENRLSKLIELMDLLEQGTCHITWQDRTVVKIEKIITESVIKK